MEIAQCPAEAICESPIVPGSVNYLEAATTPWVGPLATATVHPLQAAECFQHPRSLVLIDQAD